MKIKLKRMIKRMKVNKLTYNLNDKWQKPKIKWQNI